MLLFLRRTILLSGLVLSLSSLTHAQNQIPALGDGPWVFDTVEQDFIKVSVLARGMDHPYGLEFVPGTVTEEFPLGDIIITERTGKVRLFRDGRLLEQPVVDLAQVFPLNQLFDIELHPDFTENRLAYFTWIKQLPHPDGPDQNGNERLWATTSLARGRWNGNEFEGLQEIFEADAWSDNICGANSRMHFLADGTLLLGASHRCDTERPQSLDSHLGKIMRLNDDGSAPADNPFTHIEGALPEIYTRGMRSVMDFATHPETGEIWELENGPQGGDEVNILEPGANYGWPLASYGVDYGYQRGTPNEMHFLPWVEGTVLPVLFWVPSITVGGMNFYTGDKFPGWKNNLFVTSMVEARIHGTGHLVRVVLNDTGEATRERLLDSLHQRIRFVIEGPDGLLYVLTDSDDGALLRIEPSNAEEAEMFDAYQVSREPDSLEGEALVFEGYDCAACHRTDSALLGPSWREVAQRYTASEANLAALAQKIISGGAGVWGDSPMTPHPALDMEQARDMTRRILDLQ